MPYVLMITPDPETARLISLRLELDGYAVNSAIDADEAVSIARNREYDFLLLDLVGADTNRKSEADGIKKLLRSVCRSATSIVLLPRGQMDLDRKAIGFAPNATIRRPFELNALTEILNEMRKAKRKKPVS